jgi:hypothetical protein
MQNYSERLERSDVCAVHLNIESFAYLQAPGVSEETTKYMRGTSSQSKFETGSLYVMTAQNTRFFVDVFDRLQSCSARQHAQYCALELP